MPKTQKPIHFHKYERFLWPNKNPFYKCILPNCPHYLPIATLAIGRESLCHGPDCMNLVTITKEDVSKGIVKPFCEPCKERRKEKKEELMRI